MNELYSRVGEIVRSDEFLLAFLSATVLGGLVRSYRKIPSDDPAVRMIAEEMSQETPLE